jgi:hypothetical protein
VRDDREALVVGMTLVPGYCSRNKCYALYQQPEVRAARARAALLRGIVRQLTGAQGRMEGLTVERDGSTVHVRFRVPGVRMERRATLSDVEHACVAYMASRAGISGLPVSDDDRVRLDTALRRLAEGLRLSTIEQAST